MYIESPVTGGASATPKSAEPALGNARSATPPLTSAAAAAGTAKASASTGAAAQSPLSAAALDDAVAQLNAAPQTKAQGLQFSIDPDSQRTVVKLIDSSTGDVLRQFPTQQALDIAASLQKGQAGLLINQTA